MTCLEIARKTLIEEASEFMENVDRQWMSNNSGLCMIFTNKDKTMNLQITFMFNKRSNYDIVNGKGDYVTLLIPAGGRSDLQLRRVDPDK